MLVRRDVPVVVLRVHSLARRQDYKQDCNWLCFFFFPYGGQWEHLDLPEDVGEDFTGEALLELKYEEV